ncbi:MAG: 23S rRNA (uracil(1939)-C(5))-methyltransferase RlmD [Xanthomonadales bacterium]|nr:23S rRNA (uracil(1939)-C(5))-methyltransferase RlmD [Xanthomonadales bacterium]
MIDAGRALQEFDIDIHDLSHDGRGVGRVDGKAVFVVGALPGERVRARATQRKKQFDQATTTEVLRASPERVAPRCAHFGLCGGCALQHLDPAAQIAAKQRTLVENLQRIGQVQPERVLAPLTGPVWGYRRKARLGAKWVAKKERVLVGFREAADPRFIADIDRCEVLVPEVGARLGELSALIQSLESRAAIPQIEVAAGDHGTALVLRHLQPLSEADRSALRAFAAASGLHIMLQSGGVDSVLALDGEGPELSFEVPHHRVSLRFEALDFIQVNRLLNEAMIDRALELLALQPQHRVLDLFCGLGNFTLPIARRVREVIGVEGDAGLVRRANQNAAANGLDNAHFHAADLVRELAGQPWMQERFDRVLIDPPRTGAEEVIRAMDFATVPRLVYVSCHPGSLARDAGILVREKGFRLAAAGVMDMFPHTAHVESIALFEKD